MTRTRPTSWPLAVAGLPSRAKPAGVKKYASPSGGAAAPAAGRHHMRIANPGMVRCMENRSLGSLVGLGLGNARLAPKRPSAFRNDQHLATIRFGRNQYIREGMSRGRGHSVLRTRRG